MADLLPIRDPYASVWVAVYEPLIIEWLGWQPLADLRVRYLARQAPAREAGARWAPTLARYQWAGQRADPDRAEPRPIPGGTFPGGVLEGIPGVVLRDEDRSRAAASALPPLVATIGARAVAPILESAELDRRRKVLDTIIADEALSADGIIKVLEEENIPHFCGTSLRRELSPVGIAHLYRQLYFDGGAGVGPIEQVVGIAPNEVLEISQEVTRRRTIETIEEIGASETYESEVTEQTMDEISEQVQSSISNDVSVAVSASASGTIGVFSGSGSAAVGLQSSSERSVEVARRHSLERTRRAAQIVQRSHTLTVRSTTELSDRSTMRRVIRNDSDTPVNYALRRVMRKIRVKVQAIGPRLVWQLYICRPGQRLARSRMVMFREADPVAQPGLPPNAPPRPQGGIENGTQTVQIKNGAIVLSVANSSERTISSLTVDSLFDPSPDGKDARAPVLTGEAPEAVASGNPQFVAFRIKVNRGTATSATVNFTIYFDPSAAVLAEWEQKVAAARAEWEANGLEQQFERAKRLIEAKSRVPPRPAADLRQEERYEILNRLISEAFQHTAWRSLPPPVEIEVFHRLFDVSGLYYFVHPSWWEPRYMAQRGEYEITDESAPAPLGASLGWMLQMDGDRRRNEFLNSPWVRSCIPMRPGMEREAMQWLAQHIEGTRGFSLEPTHPVGKLLAEVEARRAQETSATPGPDYVTLDGQVPPERIAASEAFPVVEEFEVLQPTEGFVYETLTIES